MFDIRKNIAKTFETACTLLRQEKEFHIQTIRLVGELYRTNAAVNLNLPEREFLRQLGLTRDQFYNRALAARVIHRFPDYEQALQKGEVSLSVLALVAPKITDANSEVILANVRGKSKREARVFLSKVDYEGHINKNEGMIEISLLLKESDLEKLEQARSVLAAGGKVPTNAEIFLRGLDDLLERRDPIRKAERAAALAAKKVDSHNSCRNDIIEATESGGDLGQKLGQRPSFRNAAAVYQSNDIRVDSSFRNDQPKESTGSWRPAIPRAIQHQVWLRDGRRCTHKYPDGSRCEETLMLELDHREPWSRGGDHSVKNLHVVCRRHNQSAAEKLFGHGFMQKHCKIDVNARNSQ